MGGWFTIDGKLTHSFSCTITKDGELRFDTLAGTCEGQQLWECLSVLVAVDVWSTKWNQSRIQLKVGGDNFGALTMLIINSP